ncbi:phage regulatory protein [Ligilactobacillus agilis]|uniref:Phage regulatory protein n=1 Tax=Ligilactobacillus agilis TaxID=1601 RepID=A0A2I2A8P5_9LACO|nr:Rha family transcriptional regulator [Ligilactobacillus agilis]PLA75748.1 phage regulatory protein [Ligilactobacillus agilis]
MNELVIMRDQQAVTTSLILAEAFGKQHKNVIQAIEGKIEPAENSARYRTMFSKGIYTDKKGEQRKMYYLNRDGFTFIAMGFTGRKADEFKLKYIEAFNKMEEQIKQAYLMQKQDSYMIDDPIQRAQRWIEEREEYKAKLEVMYEETQNIQDNTPISSKDYQVLSRKIGEKLERYINQHRIYNRNQIALLRWDLNNAILTAAGVPARTLIRQKHFTAVAEALVNWEPSLSTLEKLKAY